MNAVAKLDKYEVMEKVIGDGDLSKLSAKERLDYYNQTCKSLGLNPLTQPFKYIRLNGKLALYATKDCSEQLRKINHISIFNMKTEVVEGVYTVTVHAKDEEGREDIATGAVSIEGLKGENRANAILKAETKAKRRVTLSICGLGFMDESEVEYVPQATPIDVDVKTGEILTLSDANVKEDIVGDAIVEMQRAINLDQLKTVYMKYWPKVKDDAEMVKLLNKQKDQCKASLEGTAA